MPETLTIFMRWLHLTSMAALVGGILYARAVIAPAMARLPAESAKELGNRAAALYRPLVWGSVLGLLLSGGYKLMITPGHRTVYHALFGIKMLLALHVFAVALVIAKPDNPRRTRQMTGTLISGLAIILISAWLSRIF